MGKKTYNALNSLLAQFFDTNAVVDNLAYNLEYNYYNEIANIVHQKIAHKMPEIADEISSKMLELDMRPVRKAIGEYTYEAKDLDEVFNILLDAMTSISNSVRGLIKIADNEKEDEIRIFSENLLDELTKYVKQCNEWLNAAKKLNANDMNIHIYKYTHFIKIDLPQ